MTTTQITQVEFLEQYKSLFSLSEEDMQSRAVMICTCGYPACRGWAMVDNNSEAIAEHHKLCQPKKARERSYDR